MVKDDTRALLIAEGAKLIHEKGFNHTGVQEILQAAGVPKGSFYFYFRTKEEFGLAVVDFFLRYMGSRMESHLSDPTLPHIKRLKNFFDEMMEYFRHEGCARGCPIGNLAQELADLSDTFRKKLQEAMAAMEAGIMACLQAAMDAGEVAHVLDAREAASFIFNSWEGALTRMKTEKNLEPLIIFNRVIFDLLLRTPDEQGHRRP